MDNLLYFEEYTYQTVLNYCNEKIIKTLNFEKLIHKLCLKEHTTYKGRIEAVKELYGFKYNTPIYINQKNIFVKIPQDEYNLWVNVLHVVSINELESFKTIINFMNGENVMALESKKRIKDIIKKGQIILNKTV